MNRCKVQKFGGSVLSSLKYTLGCLFHLEIDKQLIVV